MEEWPWLVLLRLSLQNSF